MHIQIDDTDEGVRFRQFRCNDIVADILLPVASKEVLAAQIRAHLQGKPNTAACAIRSTDKSVFLDFTGNTRIQATWRDLFAELAQ